MKDNDIHEELDDLSPFLSNHKKNRQHGQSALPEDYFTSFESRLMNKIQEDDTKPLAITTGENKPWIAPVMVLLKPKYLSLAAACMLGFVVAWQYIGNDNVDINTVATTELLADLSLAETQSYLLENVEDLELDELAGIIEDTELDEIQEEQLLIEKEESVTSVEESKAIELGKTNEVTPKKSAIKKAIDKAKTKDLLDDITEDDLDSYELF